VSASNETDSVCHTIRARDRAETVGRGHHFSRDYARLVQLALQ
jgi:type IV secretory pathway VirJ component